MTESETPTERNVLIGMMFSLLALAVAWYVLDGGHFTWLNTTRTGMILVPVAAALGVIGMIFTWRAHHA